MSDAKDAKSEAKSDGKDKADGGKREMKRSPNRLIVDESHGEGDNSVVMLSLAKMEGKFAIIFLLLPRSVAFHLLTFVLFRVEFVPW